MNTRGNLSIWMASAAMAATLAFGAAAPAFAEASTDWSISQAESTTTVRHDEWTALLRAATVADKGRVLVAYDAASGNPQVRNIMTAYLARLQKVDPTTLNRNEQLAYWLNLHNAVTVNLMMDQKGKGKVDKYRGFPTSEGKLFAQPAVTINGVAMSPDQIINDVLRPNFAGTNFHYGLFTAAMGSPSLQREPFEGTRVEAQLTRAARSFVNGGNVAVRKGKVEASSLYEWYRADFGGDDAAVISHIKQFAEGKLATDLLNVSAVGKFNYDFTMASFQPRPVATSSRDVGGGGFGGGGFGGGGGGGGSFGGGGS